MKIMIASALAQERINLADPVSTIYQVETGVGKAMAALHLTKAIMKVLPDVVINVGTAGTLIHHVGDILVCSRFVDRDFARLRLPGIQYEINAACPEIASRWKSTIPGNSFTVNTGDDFVTDKEHLEGDVIDMEAFAEALVCAEFQIPFVSVKYITDVVGQNSVKHWEDKLADARTELNYFFKNLSL